MLILSRKTNESIIINGEIEIRIVSVDDGRVRLGIVAPHTYEVHRKEVYEKIQIENQAASEASKSLEKLKEFRVQEENRKNHSE